MRCSRDLLAAPDLPFYPAGLMTPLIALLLTFPALSEPWVSNRFAQNCAACHAPARFNRTLKDRRCTLSCQGCHVNPNGGGLRNFYGRWNSQRWLRSFEWKVQGKEKERPLPWFAQGYTPEKQAQEVARALESDKPKSLHPKAVPSSREDRVRLIQSIRSTTPLRSKNGNLTASTSDASRGEFETFNYERANGDSNWNVEAKSLNQFESTIPDDDPYHLKKKQAVLVGMDFRYTGRMSFEENSENSDTAWPMALDIGVQIKPLIHVADNWSLVIETRYFNPPDNSDLEYTTNSRVRNRSTYLLIDDLYFNSFIMYGIYRPMFEHYSPDHTSLAQNILYKKEAFSHNNKAFTIGSAPNIPFINFTLIEPMKNSSPDSNHEKGYIVNLGARAVILGASIIYSYKTVKDEANSNLATEAHSINGGLAWKRFIVNGEVLRISREYDAGKFDDGTIYTGETRFRLWKEFYAEAIYEHSNVAAELGNLEAMKKGNSSQLTVGFRFFPLVGVNVSTHIRTVSAKQVNGGGSYKEKQGLFQAHLYF